MSVSAWEIPELAASELTYAVTSSVLEQFAQGHTIGDVLRELVQNEYDARGSSLSVTFGAEGLEVHGNGHLIDGSERALKETPWVRTSIGIGTPFRQALGDGWKGREGELDDELVKALRGAGPECTIPERWNERPRPRGGSG